jgi:hypothetical protein
MGRVGFRQFAPHHTPASPRQGCQVYGNEIPFAPF